MLNRIDEALKNMFGELVEGLNSDQKRMVFSYMADSKVERVTRKQVHMLRLNVNTGVAEEISTSETRWIRELCPEVLDADGVVSDFIVVDFDKTQRGYGKNFFAISRGAGIDDVASTDSNRETMWLNATEGKTYKLFLQSPSQQRTAAAIFMVDKGVEGGYSKQWVDAITKITYGWFPKDPMAIAKFLSATGLAQSSSQVASARVSFKIAKDYSADNGFGEFEYTDGMGLISFEMMENIAATLGLNYVPAAVQVRISGIKGLLLKWDIEGSDVLVAKSMVKMIPEGVDRLPLEICLVSKKVSEMNPFTYQFINAIDIKADTLKQLVDRHLDMLNGILTDPVKAMKYLGMVGDDEETDEDGRSAYDTTLRSKVMRALDANPITLFDPWVQSKMKQHMERSILDMAKGRVPVSGGFYFGASEPIVLVGGELLLERGQAFLNGKTGEHGIFRTPCIHRSEVCTLELVTSPELERVYGHLKDVLIINVKDYTLTREGGADCDGDKFFVTDEPAIVEAVENLPDNEIIFGEDQGKPKTYAITWEKVIEHVYRKAKMSLIGHATDLATTYSDKFRSTMNDSEKDAYDKNVIALRMIQGKLIDSAKKEYDVAIDQYLETPERPHWLERGGKSKPYHSVSPMGMLYDYVHLVYKQFMEANTGMNYNLVVNMLEQVDPNTFYLIEGMVSTYLKGYNTDIQYILDRFGLLDENGTTKDKRNSSKDIQDDLSDALKLVAEKYQGLMDTLGALADPESVAITAYFLSYQKASNGRGYSFPWTACADALISAFSRIPGNRFMLTPVKPYKGMELPETVEVKKGLMFAGGDFVGISALSDGTYGTMMFKNLWYAKVPRKNSLTVMSAPKNKYQFTLVGIVPETIAYLRSQVGGEIVVRKYMVEEGVLAYGLFYDNYRIGKVADSAILAAAHIVDKPVSLMDVIPSRSGKSVDLYIEVQ